MPVTSHLWPPLVGLVLLLACVLCRQALGLKCWYKARHASVPTWKDCSRALLPWHLLCFQDICLERIIVYPGDWVHPDWLGSLQSW